MRAGLGHNYPQTNAVRTSGKAGGERGAAELTQGFPRGNPFSPLTRLEGWGQARRTGFNNEMSSGSGTGGVQSGEAGGVQLECGPTKPQGLEFEPLPPGLPNPAGDAH